MGPRAVGDRPEQQRGRSVTDLRTERATEVPQPEPAPAPDLRDRDERPPGGPAAVLPQGVELARLLALVRLTAPEGVSLALG